MTVSSEYITDKCGPYFADNLSVPSSSSPPSIACYQIMAEEESTKSRSTCTEESGYYEHIILPSDTLQGICLQYKITPTRLRQVNQFSGSFLLLAPKRLRIPKKREVIVKQQERGTDEYKIHCILASFQFLSEKEVKAYLNMNDWDVEKTMAVITDDQQWEEQCCVREKFNTCRQEWERIYAPPTLDIVVDGNMSTSFDRKQKKHELVVGVPVDFNVKMLFADGNIRRTMAMHGTSEFGIEMKDLSSDAPSTRSLELGVPHPTIALIPS